LVAKIANRDPREAFYLDTLPKLHKRQTSGQVTN